MYAVRHCLLITPCPAKVAVRLTWRILLPKWYCTHHLPVQEVWKTGSMRLTHSTALSRNMWSSVSSKAPMRPPTTRMLVSNRLMRRLELHFKLVLTHSLALWLTFQECHSSWQNGRRDHLLWKGYVCQIFSLSRLYTSNFQVINAWTECIC